MVKTIISRYNIKNLVDGVEIKRGGRGKTPKKLVGS